MLTGAGWVLIAGGKGSHTKWMHPRVSRRITLSGNDGQDAKHYQEKDVIRGLREAGR